MCVPIMFVCFHYLLLVNSYVFYAHNIMYMHIHYSVSITLSSYYQFIQRTVPFLLFLRFAFNAGSAESISGKAIHAAVGRIALVMCLGCASAGIFQTCISGLVQIHKQDETFNSNEIANALLGGLVSVTGCCPFIDPRWAILIGGKLTLSYRPPSVLLLHVSLVCSGLCVSLPPWLFH